MTQSDDHADQRFDELLRELGPEVPHPALDAPARARLLASIDDADGQQVLRPIGRSPGWMKWIAPTCGSLAAVLAVACALLWINLGQVKDQLATEQSRTREAIQLFAYARHSQQAVPLPEDLEGVRSADLVLITFHHELCPIAAFSTPRFREMQQRHRGEPARFITFDVSGDKRDAVVRELDSLGMTFALMGPTGAETGVVKVLDMTRHRVLSSAPGRQGIEQAESLLARVSSGSRQ